MADTAFALNQAERDKRADIAVDTITSVAGLMGLSYDEVMALLDSGVSIEEFVALIAASIDAAFGNRIAGNGQA